MTRDPRRGRCVPDILNEAEEEYRAERAQQMLARYGWIIGAVALLVVAGLGGREAWRWNERREAAAAAETYLAAGRAAAAQGADLRSVVGQYDALAKDAPAGYRTLARLRAAALKAESGDRAGALAEWDALARDGGVDSLYRDLATLNWALHGLDEGPGGIDPATLESRLAPLANGPWKASVAELRALVALRRGDAAAARGLLTPLVADLQAPQGVRDRAQRLLAGLGG
jgi:hypothetical protein